MKDVKCWTWDKDYENKIFFESETRHCDSCLDEKEMGYGYDISGCCCTHINELDESIKEISN